MNKQIAYIAICLIAQILSACSNTDDAPCIPQTHNASYTDALTRSSLDLSYDSIPTLYFDSYEEYAETLYYIRSLDTDMEKRQWVHNKYPGFVSIHDVYEQAGEEAAMCDLETEDQFNSFCNKYSCLFFPLEEEDAGFYVPIKDEGASYLANINCRVIIGDNIINLRDIHNYSDLQECGRAFYELPVPMTLASEESFALRSAGMNSVGPEYDSGWKEYGKRKVKLKARRLLKQIEPTPGFLASESYFHTEFCFRKKTWLGWINYSCKTEITGEVIIPYFYILPLKSSESGTSSHDKNYPYPIHISQDQTNIYYRYYEAPCKATVNFKDIDTPLNYSWTMTGIVCKIPLSDNYRPTIYPSNL